MAVGANHGEAFLGDELLMVILARSLRIRRLCLNHFRLVVVLVVAVGTQHQKIGPPLVTPPFVGPVMDVQRLIGAVTKLASVARRA